MSDRYHCESGEAPSPAGLCFCLLYDLCAWLARAPGPVPDDSGYELEGLRSLADPPTRLAGYLEPALLARWQRALDPFFTCGASLQPELEATGTVPELPGHGDSRGAELGFTSRSRALDGDGRRHELPRRRWLLGVRLTPDGGRVAEAWLRPA